MKIDVVANMPTDNGTFKIVGFENPIDQKEHIDNNDIEVDVSGTEFTQLKEKIPLSQLMSIYLVPIIIYGK